ncbi:hypothetical protein FGO68_gene11493 [Halteria grandinella]|uniref:Uncharacterized protein n=1 Tax=Halteria grandinella TaxID=5974 RepID=A0A8J8NR08_HALGN|nr:hypothetical protein FGO68_gene11493 [Halteria grandinella]
MRLSQLKMLDQTAHPSLTDTSFFDSLQHRRRRNSRLTNNLATLLNQDLLPVEQQTLSRISRNHNQTWTAKSGGKYKFWRTSQREKLEISVDSKKEDETEERSLSKEPERRAKSIVAGKKSDQKKQRSPVTLLHYDIKRLTGNFPELYQKYLNLNSDISPSMSVENKRDSVDLVDGDGILKFYKTNKVFEKNEKIKIFIQPSRNETQLTFDAKSAILPFHNKRQSPNATHNGSFLNTVQSGVRWSKERKRVKQTEKPLKSIQTILYPETIAKNRLEKKPLDTKQTANKEFLTHMQERVAFAQRLKSLISASQEKSKVSFKNIKIKTEIRDSQQLLKSSRNSSPTTQRTPVLQPSLQCALCGAHQKLRHDATDETLYQRPPTFEVGIDAQNESQDFMIMSIAHLIEKLQNQQQMQEPIIMRESNSDLDSLKQKLKVLELENRLLRAEIKTQDELLKNLKPLIDKQELKSVKTMKPDAASMRVSLVNSDKLTIKSPQRVSINVSKQRHYERGDTQSLDVCESFNLL